jgi:anti-sigma B factor antagonist
MALTYNLRDVKDVAFIDLVGHLNVGEATPFGAGRPMVLSDLVRELAGNSKKKIVINLGDVAYVDSSGIGQLVRALSTARHNGADIKLLNPVSSVFGLLRVTKLDKVFDVKDDEDSVIAAFAASHK